MCSFCEELNRGNSTSYLIEITEYQKHPYPLGVMDMTLYLRGTRESGEYRLVAHSTAWRDTYEKRDAADVTVSSRIYYCPYCGEKF